MENIFTVSKPFLLFSRTIGLFPMSLKLSSNFFSQTCKLGSISSSLSIIGLSIVFIFYSTIDFKLFQRSQILPLAWDIAMNVETLTHIFLLIFQIGKRKKIIKFLWLIYEIDKEVKLNRVVTDKSKKKLFSGENFPYWLDQTQENCKQCHISYDWIYICDVKPRSCHILYLWLHHKSWFRKRISNDACQLIQIFLHLSTNFSMFGCSSKV